MNILYTISSLEDISGPSHVVYLLSSGLVERHHKVTVAYYFGPINDVFRKKMDRQGIRLINLYPESDELGRLDHLKLFVRLLRVIRKHNIDIVHAHSFDADIYSVISGLVHGCKQVVTIHSLSYYKWVRQNIMKYRIAVIPFVDQFICVSKNLEQEAIKHFNIVPAKVCTLNNAPDDKFFMEPNGGARKRIRDRFHVLDDDILIGTVGNILPAKGLEHLLDAVSLLQYRYRTIKIVFAGRITDYQKELEGIVKHKGLIHVVTFAGFMDNIPSFLDAIDLYVHPSVDEADPLSILEAMAKGKTIIASDVGDVSGKIITGKTGILVKPADTKALKNAIQYCIENPLRGRHMGREAKTLVRERFSRSQMIEKTIGVYKTLIGN